MKDKEMTNDECIRFYDESGNHMFSVLTCGINEDGSAASYDLAHPDGKVYFCDTEVGKMFVRNFGHLIEKI